MTRSFPLTSLTRGRLPGELAFNVGDVIFVTARFDDGWCEGTLLRTQEEGLFPGSHVRRAVDKGTVRASFALRAKNQQSKRDSL